MLNIKHNLQSIEKLVINFLIKDKSQINFNFKVKIINLLNSSYFYDETIEVIFKIAKNYFFEYNGIPDIDEIKQLVEIQNYNIDPEKIDALFDYPIGKYKYEYIYGWVKTFVLVKRTNSTFLNINSRLKQTTITPDNVNEEINNLIDYFNQNININFDTFSNIGDFDNAEHHYQPELSTTDSGFRFFNKVIGGWNPKTLIAFQAKPKAGKCVLGNQYITVKNKKTGEVEQIKYKDFYERVQKGKK